jgi:hypothetical protein
MKIPASLASAIALLLDRGVPSGITGRIGSVSGVHAAVAPPVVPLDALVEGAFPEEEDTAVDRDVLPPAETEKDTVTLPIDIAAMLRRASVRSEPPPTPKDDDET